MCKSFPPSSVKEGERRSGSGKTVLFHLMSIKKRAVAPYSIKSGSLLQPLRSFQGRYSIKIGYKSNKTIQICTLFFCHQHVTRSHSRICFRQIRQIIRQIALSSADDSRPFHHRRPSADLPYMFTLLYHHQPEHKPPPLPVMDLRKNPLDHGGFSCRPSNRKSAAGQSHHYPWYMEIWENGFAEDSIQLLTLLKRVVFC